MGAVGTPKYGPESPVRPEQGLLKLRKELGLFCNLRYYRIPAISFSNLCMLFSPHGFSLNTTHPHTIHLLTLPLHFFLPITTLTPPQ